LDAMPLLEKAKQKNSSAHRFIPDTGSA
jgi:hypothetical protein